MEISNLPASMPIECLEALTGKIRNFDGLVGNSAAIRQALLKQDGFTAIRMPGFLDASQLDAICHEVDELEEHWNRGSGEGEYTLGRVWYAAVDNEDTASYFEEAEESNDMMVRCFPGLYEKIFEFCRLFADTPQVVLRPGWAGPAITIFMPGSASAEEEIGGSIHIDHDGLPVGFIDASDAEMYSFICPLSLPETGGGLRVWPADRYHPSQKTKYIRFTCEPEGPMQVVPYSLGTLVGINGLNLHQVEPFEGDTIRICLTFHLANCDNQWQVWF